MLKCMFCRTWFYPDPAKGQVPNSKAHAIYATSWRNTSDGYLPLAWSQDVEYVNGIDVTRHYTNTGQSLRPSLIAA